MHVLNTLLLVWSLLPLAGMLAALGYAVWSRQPAPAPTPARPRSPRPDAG